MNALFSRMPRRRLSPCACQVLVFFDDASVFDERQVVRARGVFRLSTPGAWRKPDGLGMLGGRLLDVIDDRIASSEDHHHIHGPSEVIEACKGRQSSHRGAIRTHRNDVEPRAVEI